MEPTGCLENLHMAQNRKQCWVLIKSGGRDAGTIKRAVFEELTDK